MKLTAKGRYAVMALSDLARHSTGHPIPLAEIAERQDISLSYLEQLFAKLRRAGLVTSVRGPGGGYRLAQPATRTPIADIVLAVDQPVETNRCTPAQPCGCRESTTECLTHGLWEQLGNQIYLYLSAVSLADVIEQRVVPPQAPDSHDADGPSPEPA